jgi:hypothetical protein
MSRLEKRVLTKRRIADRGVNGKSDAAINRVLIVNAWNTPVEVVQLDG